MELDVHLKKDGDESWGFRLIGGKDFAMPLTVVKVVPESPAAVAGLRHGDAVCRLNGADAGDMSLGDAKQFVADANELTLGVTRGLYDPVLDDFDPVYEPIDQDDFDQPSQPTEVDPFKIQQFLDPGHAPEGLQYLDPRRTPAGQYLDPRLTPGGLPELRDIETPRFNGTPGLNGTGLDQSRSLTASPFVLPTKPYRPFSTEPLPEIPPLEDPIILNPNYQDIFGKRGDGTNGYLDGEVFPETRFKLPISEQYDPDGTKRKKKEDSMVKEVKFVTEEIKTMKKDVSVTEVKYSAEIKQKALEEKKFMEKMKKEIDLDKIEMTAVSVVDESIERAVSVTDEIKKEIDLALCESSLKSTKVDESKSVKESSMVSSEISKTESVKESTAKSSKLTSEKVSKDTTELVDLIDKTTEEIICYNGHQSEVSVAKEVQKFESQDKKEQIVDERRLSTKQEIEETVEIGSVRRKSEVFDKKVESKSVEMKEKVEKKTDQVKEKDVNKKDIKKREETQVQLATEKDMQKKDFKAESQSQKVSHTAQKSSATRKESISSQKTGVKSSTTSSQAKLQSDHTKAYLIGLQTIPSIKGTIHAYHYHLLLKTFFIHLTDVMVALSRFILTEPAFTKTEQSQDITMQESVTEYKENYEKDDHHVEEKVEVVERKRSIVEEKQNFERIKEEKAVAVEAVEAIEAKQEIKKAEKVMAVEETVMERKEEKLETKAQVVERVVDHQDDSKAVAQEKVVEAIEDRIYRDEVQENLEVEQIMDRKEKLSGAQMAQIQERKSAELTQRMDAVITEFQNKAGIEELEITRERRSRSRSKVEEEVMLESDPLEWLSKKEMQQKEITEMKTESKSFSSSMESTEKKRVEKHERREKSSKSKEGKQMYIAIVESHTFTNKDAIFEEQVADFSETSSVVSADEINIALQASETVAMEKVTLERKEVKKEVAETVLEESRELNVVNAQTEAVVHVAEEIQSTAVVEETKAIVEEVKEEKAVEVETKVEQEVVIQEIVEPVIEVQEMMSVKISEEFQKVSVKEEEHIMEVSENTEISVAETHESIAIEEVKKEEYAAISIEESKAVEVTQEEIKEEVVKEETKVAELVKQEVKRVEYVPPPVQEVSVELRVVQRARSRTPVYQEESAALTIVKPAKTPTEEKQELIFSEQSDLSISKETEILGSDSQYSEIHRSKMEYESTEIQESSFTAKSSETGSYKAKSSETADLTSTAKDHSQLTLDLQARRESQSSVFSFPSTIDTPTPASVPPTPFTDEYMFKLKAKTPKEDGTPIPRDCTPTPEDEDPHIVKKKLLPYIDTTLESPIIYDPPLPSPPLSGGKPQSPVYTKPGLKGGCEKQYFRKEEILEIERKSSLLASAIDETIKSIEEYKEEVGIDTKKEVETKETSKFEKTASKTVTEHTVSKSEITVKSSTEAPPIIYNGFAKVETKVYDTIENNKIDDEWKDIDKQVKESNDELTELSNNIDVEVDVTLKVNGDKSTVNVEKKSLDTKHIETTALKACLNETEDKKEELTATFIIKAENKSSSKNSKEIVTSPTQKEVVEKKEEKGLELVKEKEVQLKEEDSKSDVTINHSSKAESVTSEIMNKTEIMNGDMKEDSQKPVMNGEMTEVSQKSVINGEMSEAIQKSVTTEEMTRASQKCVIAELMTSVSQKSVQIEDMSSASQNTVMNGDVILTQKAIEDVSQTSTMNGTDVAPKSEMNGIPKAVIEKPPPMFAVEEKKDPMAGYRPIQFDPEEIKATKRGLQSIHLSVQPVFQRAQSPSYVDSKGALLGTQQGIVDSLEEAVVDEEVAKELGKPGMTEQKIAELISGESEMLREAHVMGLSRVLRSHMHRPDDDSSVDFKKIKPIIESLKDSEVLKALNEEIERAREEKRREEEKKWTTFLQKPKRPVPRAKFGYPGWVQEEPLIEEPYKVKIVKQPKPKVAPDYKPKNFETGPLPWEERALNEPPAPPVEAEEPILIPEEIPEFLEAVDPLPESEVPDLEDTGITLPPPKPVEEEPAPSPAPAEDQTEDQEPEPEELDLEAVVEETENIVAEMEQNRLAEQLLMGVQSMVDPNASVEQQLSQMRAQMAALAQLPGVIQQTLDLVTRQLSQLSQAEVMSQQQVASEVSMCAQEMRSESRECNEVTQNVCEVIEEEQEATQEAEQEKMGNGEEYERPTIIEVEDTKPTLTQEELEKLRREEEEMMEEQRRVEKQKKEMMEQMRLEQESRQVKQRPTPRVGKPKPVFGPPTPVARPLVLPGGRKWRKPEDAYNEAFIKETLSAQAELIQGKAMGINFMKYEKPPVSLDHLQHSETYKLIHDIEQAPAKRVELRTPVIAEADYREKCRSVTPSTMVNPQQVHP